MNCKKAKKLETLFWEQSKTCQEELNLHWQNCPECGASFQNLANSIELCRQNLQSEEKPEDFSHYWHKLSKCLVRPTWPEMAGQKIKGALSLVSRSIWGPVPAYAVVGLVLIAVYAILPLSQNGITVFKPAATFRSNLVVERLEPNGANSKDGLTVYTFAQNTTPTPAPSVSPSSTSR